MSESFTYGNGRPVAPMPVKPPKPRKEPKPKRPLHATVTDGLLVLLAAASLGLSGWSLATLLMEAGAPVWVACLGVGVFDLVALAAGLQVYARRSAPHTAGGARMVMMLALIASSIVNGAHGVALGGWTTAVVLAAAPLSFEIVFELRHRTLTALIWILFRREAALALRRDAWERIAPIAAQPVMTVEREPREVPARGFAETEARPVSGSLRDPRTRAALEAAARQVGAQDVVGEALARWDWERGGGKEAAEAAEREARAAAWVRQESAQAVSAEQDDVERDAEALALYRAVMSTPGAPEADRTGAAEALADASRREPIARPANTSPLVKRAATEEVASGGGSADRVPEQRPPSINAGVAEMRAAGIEDPEVMTARLSALRRSPVSLASVKREVRRQTKAEREAAERAAAERQTGQYL